MPRSPIPIPWCWRRWTAAATHRRAWCSARKSTPQPGFILFYTNYQSRKGRELEANPRAAVVFHWDHRHRQVRAEGPVEPLSDAENDAYFRTRAWQSRLGAWASQQSQPVESRQALVDAVAASAHASAFRTKGRAPMNPSRSTWMCRGRRIGADIACMPEAVELWVEGEFRIHDRARWTRSLSDRENTDATWSVTRLQP